MTNWHPSGQPHTSHSAGKYWHGVAQAASSSTPRPTTPVRNDGPQLVSWQPPIVRSQVVTSGLADGPSGG